MSNFQRMPDGTDKDKQLWEIAQKRASFKSHLIAYLVVNTFLWITWAMNGSHTNHNGIPWPLWASFGWGIGLAFHYMGAYVYPKANSVEREYEKLKKEQEHKQ